MNYTTIETVADRLISTFKLKEWEYDLEDIVEDVAEALKLIGAEKVFAVRTCGVKVKHKTAKLPSDMENIMRVLPDMYYQFSGGFIVIDVPDDTEVIIEYQAMPADDRGYPLVPDNAAVREALVWYLAKNLILGGVIKTVGLGYADQEWHWRCGSARAELNVMSIKSWETVAHNFTKLNTNSSSSNPNIRFILDREKNRLFNGR